MLAWKDTLDYKLISQISAISIPANVMEDFLHLSTLVLTFNLNVNKYHFTQKRRKQVHIHLLMTSLISSPRSLLKSHPSRLQPLPGVRGHAHNPPGSALNSHPSSLANGSDIDQ